MFLVTLNYPIEMQNFFALLFPLLTFDVLPVDPLYEKIFKFSNITTDSALTDQFSITGYSSVFVVNNIGSLFVIALFQIGISMLLWVTREYKLLKF